MQLPSYDHRPEDTPVVDMFATPVSFCKLLNVNGVNSAQLSLKVLFFSTSSKIKSQSESRFDDFEEYALVQLSLEHCHVYNSL